MNHLANFLIIGILGLVGILAYSYSHTLIGTLSLLAGGTYAFYCYYKLRHVNKT